MQDSKRITQLGLDNIEAVLHEHPSPIFVACLRKDSHFHEDLMHLEAVASFFGDAIEVCIIAEEILTYFSMRFRVSGTPTFLVFLNGELTATLLGRNPSAALIDFVLEQVPHIQGQAGPNMVISGRQRERPDRSGTS